MQLSCDYCDMNQFPTASTSVAPQVAAMSDPVFIAARPPCRNTSPEAAPRSVWRDQFLAMWRPVQNTPPPGRVAPKGIPAVIHDIAGEFTLGIFVQEKHTIGG
jgi:hypothetical protein